MKDFGFQQEVFFERFRKLTDIDSTTGYYRPIQDFIAAEMEAMGYRPEPLHKGGIMTTTGEDNVVMKGNSTRSNWTGNSEQPWLRENPH